MHRDKAQPEWPDRVTTLAALLPADLLLAIDLLISIQPDPKPSREDVIRTGLRNWLASLGLLFSPDRPDLTN